MWKYIKGCGYEAGSIYDGFYVIYNSRMADRRRNTLHTIYQDLDERYIALKSNPSLHDFMPIHILENPGMKELIRKAYCGHISKFDKDGSDINVHARWTTSCDSYKQLEINNNIYTQFCGQYDDDENNLSLVLYYLSHYNKEYSRKIYFCFDFVETPKIQALRRLEE